MSDEARLDAIEATLARLTLGFRYADEIHAMRRWRAVDRIRRSFLHPAPNGLQPITRRAYLGLGRWKRMIPVSARERRRLAAPAGWRWLKVPDRAAAVCMPLWLYWPVRLWRDRSAVLLGTLYRLGLWHVDASCFWWADGRATAPAWLRRLTWCFLNDRDAVPAGFR